MIKNIKIDFDEPSMIVVKMSSKFNKYYALLSQEHKAIYDAYTKEFKEKDDIRHRWSTKMRIIYEKLSDNEEYKKIRNMPTDTPTEWNLWEEAIETFRDNFPDFRAVYEGDKIARQNFGEIYNKITKFRAAVYILYEMPEPKATPTDDETKQCTICTVNLKDYALPCGHVYCIECIGKMKCECPTCKKSFVKSKCIKLFL